MEIKDFVFQKIEQLQSFQRETKILVTGINQYLKEITSNNIEIGQKTNYEGVNYEVIDFKAPEIYEWSYINIEELKYKVLGLRLVNGEIDKSHFGKRLRKDQPWLEWHYSRKHQEKLKKYQEVNTIHLVNMFYVKFK